MNEINIICLNKNNEQVTLEEAEKEYYAHKKKTREMILHELKTQNNQATAHPMYCVMEIVEIGEKDHDGKKYVYQKIEMMREVFFTNKEAEQYIEEYKITQDGELFIYIKSGYRNEGWKLARELMKGDDSDT